MDENFTVEAAVRADIALIAVRDPVLAKSGLAASALMLAREMDGDNSATSKSMCAKALMDALEQLRALAPAAERKDDLDGIKSRAALTLVRGSDTAG